MRAFMPATVVALFLISTPAVHSEKFAVVDQICPVCAEKYQARVHVISSARGMRLDLKPIGCTAPSPVPMCPKCGFVHFREDEYPAAELKTLKEFVGSDAYKKLVKDRETPHFCLARTYAHLKRDPHQVAFLYLKATWEAEDDKESKDRAKRYLAECLTAYEAAAGTKSKVADAVPTARYLCGELLRRLGKFDEARAHFEGLKKDKVFDAGAFPKLLEAQLKLVGEKDTLPNPAPSEREKD